MCDGGCDECIQVDPFRRKREAEGLAAVAKGLQGHITAKDKVKILPPRLCPCEPPLASTHDITIDVPLPRAPAVSGAAAAADSATKRKTLATSNHTTHINNIRE